MVALQYQDYTVEEFLALDLPEDSQYELVDGIITPMSEPSPAHEALRSDLLIELGMENRRSNLGMILHPKPLLWLGPKDTRRPDWLLSIAKPGLRTRFKQC